jgi:hypothetical protein
MRSWISAFGAGAVALAVGAFFACGGSSPEAPDASTDAPVDRLVPSTFACVVSPKPTPFPSGACSSPVPGTPDAFDEALQKIGYDRCTLRLDTKKMPLSVMDVTDVRQLPDFTPLLSYPLRLPAYGAETARWLDEAVLSDRPVSRAIAAASVRRGASLDACPPPEWFVLSVDDATPLATAMGDAAAELGQDFDAAAAKDAVAAIPLELQRALAPIVRAMAAATRAIAEARASIGTFTPRFRVAPDWVMGTGVAYAWNAQQLAAWDGIDVKRMSQAALHVASVVEAADLSRFRAMDLPAIDLQTPVGAIVLRGPGADTYLPGSASERAALLLDTGGDDVYRVPVAAANLERMLSLAVDLGGNDTYGYVEKKSAADSVGLRVPSDEAGRSGSGRTSSRVQRQGGALLGVALQWDLGAGKDVYRSHTSSQGTAVFGVGVLFDDGGDDSYRAEALVQGAAAWGIGLLLDRAGNDEYVAYASAQGYGFTQGVGALVDVSGDDTYTTDVGDPDLGGDPIYPNGQRPGKANTSLSQGCGFGHRPDSPEPGWQFAGGMGVLRDAAGKDVYKTSVFGQGCSFGLGIGLFLEGGGDDVYEGIWYVQGANAHTAVAYFHDAAGSDQYDPTYPIASTSIGVGHDYSAALHWDQGGDDTYRAPNLSLGSGNANGIGVMVVSGGTDTFTVPTRNSMGAANSTEVFGTSRKAIPTVGVFVKSGGTGTYVVGGVDAGAYTGSQWSYAPNNSDGGADGGPVLEFEKSIGVDRPQAGTVVLP